MTMQSNVASTPEPSGKRASVSRPDRGWIARHPDATAYLSFVLIITFWFRGFIFDPGHYGHRDDWTTPPTDWQNIQVVGHHLNSWTSNLFGLPVFERPMSVYVIYLAGILAKLFSADGWLISKYPFALLILAAVFTYQTCRQFRLQRQAAFCAALAYVSTPFFFDSLVTGYLTLFIGIALLPKVLITVHETFERTPSFRRLMKGFVWIGLSASTIHMAVLVTALICSYSLMRMVIGPGPFHARIRSALCVLGMGLGIALLHPPVGVLTYSVLFVSGTAEELTKLAQGHAETWITGVAPTVFQAISQVGPPYNYESNALATVSGASSVFTIGRSLLVALGMTAVALARGRARTWAIFFAIVFVVFTLLGKGINAPLTEATSWLRDLPGATVFRNVRYFTIPSAMALAMLVGIAIHSFVTRRTKLHLWASSSLAAVLIASSLGFWSGDLLDQLPPYDIAQNTLEAHKRLHAVPDNFRLLNIPMSGPAVYVGDTGRSSAAGDNPYVVWPAKPSVWVSPQPDTFPQYFSTVYHALLDPARYPIQALLNFGRIGYVLFDPHWVTRYASFIGTNGEPWLADYETIERLTVARAQQAGLVGDASLSEGSVHVARVHNSNGQRLSTPDRVVLSSPSLRHLSTASFAFPGNLQITHLQGPYARPPASYNLASEIWLDADPLDTVFLFVPPQYVFEPGLQIRQNSSDASREWVATYRNAWWYLNSDIADATKSIITKASKASFQMSLTSQAGDHELWIRHFVSPQGSSLAFSLHDTALTSIPTMATDAYGYVWTKLPLPPLVPGNHTLHIATEDAGLNAVSQVVLVPQNIVYNARDRATQSLANLPLGLVLPDLEKTDGNRRFSLPISGSFHLDTLVPDTFNPTLSIDGNPVTFTKSDSPAPGKKRLTAEVQLEAGSHILTLQPSSPLPPVSIETLTSPFQSGGSNSSCGDAPCSGAVRYLVTANSDGRTLTFDGRLHVGQYQVLAQAWQIKPQVVHYNQIHMDHQATNDISVTVPLDPGSSQALLDVRQHLGSDALLDFELLAVEQSLLPHGISITLSQVQLPATSIAGIRLSDAANPTHISGVYEGPSGRRIVRLDEKFDLRWILTINGVKVDPSAHIALDGHFNGWVVDLPSGATVRASFAVQNAHFGIQVANLTLLFLAVLAGWQPWNLLHRQSHPTPE